MLDSSFGMDVHRDTVVIAKLGESIRETRRFGVEAEELKGAMDWLRKDGCMHGVMESTGVYWVPVYTVFKEAGFTMYLANAYQVKSIPGRKSDQKDAEWLAYLLRAELIKPCYIPDERYEELRTLTRLRTKLTQTQTSFKNRVHKILQLCNIRLASKVSNLFGSSGMIILNAVMSGGDVDAAIDTCHSRIKAKREEIKKSIMGTLSETDIFELKICLDNVRLLDEQARQIDERIASKIDGELVEKLCKLPGIAPYTAAVAIAEIAEAGRFEDGNHVAGWTGLAPSRYQSAGKDRRGHINKQGNSWLRRAMVQAAKAAAKSSTEFAEFYSRVAGRRGKSIATIALARLLLTRAWSVIRTGVEYTSGTFRKKARYKLRRSKDGGHYEPDEISGVLSQASAAVAGMGDI